MKMIQLYPAMDDMDLPTTVALLEANEWLEADIEDFVDYLPDSREAA